jgi:hypothetical protein
MNSATAVLHRGGILVREGKIETIWQGRTPPAGVQIGNASDVDLGENTFILPGLINLHNHPTHDVLDPIIRELGIRESCASGTRAVFGSTSCDAISFLLRESSASRNESAGILFVTPIRRCFDLLSRTKDHVGAAASLHDSRDTRYIYASSHDRKAQGAGGRGRAFVPRKNARNVSSV